MRVISMIALLLLAASFADDEPEVGQQATVKVRGQHMFPRPVFYAQPVCGLDFGEVVDVLESEDDWFHCSTSGGLAGWIHGTSLTGAVIGEGEVGEGSGEVSSDEVMLAGRGFNSDVEDAYSSDHPDLDFELVDDMESLEVTPDELRDFLAQGGLIPSSESQQQDTPESESQGEGRGGRR
ncbi:hypothetical protein GF402_04510 [Candidatus Fermentibacteria bacterium]|nr:hypothetical protein [Candidatus Fermentibacteria bacterium]